MKINNANLKKIKKDNDNSLPLYIITSYIEMRNNGNF